MNTNKDTCLYEHNVEAIRSLPLFIENILFLGASCSNYRFIISYGIVNVHSSQIKEDSLLPYFVVVAILFKDITSNIIVLYRLHSYIE